MDISNAVLPPTFIIGILQQEGFCLTPLSTYSIIYLYQYRLVAIYCFHWIIMEYYHCSVTQALPGWEDASSPIPFLAPLTF